MSDERLVSSDVPPSTPTTSLEARRQFLLKLMALGAAYAAPALLPLNVAGASARPEHGPHSRGPQGRHSRGPGHGPHSRGPQGRYSRGPGHGPHSRGPQGRYSRGPGHGPHSRGPGRPGYL